MQYRASLDGLRGIAVLGVVLCHAAVPGVSGGGRGVDVFFVLSGYLITALLLAERDRSGSIDLPSFWIRRGARLMPPLLAMLATYVLLGQLVLPSYQQTMWRDVGLSAAYLMNYAQATAPWVSPLAHTWSLAVEEQFYLIWPIVILAITRVRRDAAIRGLIALFAAITFARIAVYATTVNFAQAYFPLHLHASGLVLGAIVALLPRGPSWLGWIGLIGIVVSFLMGGPEEYVAQIVWQTSFAEFATAALLLGLRDESLVGRLLSAPPLVGLGLISYGVYLWHFPITEAIESVPFVDAVVTLVVSIGCATLSYFTVERWSRLIRDRYRARGLLQSPAA